VLTVDRVAGVALTVLGLFVLHQSRALPLGTLGNPGPAYMPVVLAALLAVLGIALAVLGGHAPPLSAPAFRECRHAVAILATCAFCALALERLGYRLTICAALLFLLGVVERKRPLAAAVFAVAFAVGTFFLFDRLLRVPLPRGPLGL
jgi:putative tricarboxylic transport membrane protein